MLHLIMAVLPDVLWSVSYTKSLMGNGCGNSNSPWCSALRVSPLHPEGGSEKRSTVLVFSSIDVFRCGLWWGDGLLGKRRAGPVCVYLRLRRGKDIVI